MQELKYNNSRMSTNALPFCSTTYIHRECVGFYLFFLKIILNNYHCVFYCVKLYRLDQFIMLKYTVIY